MRKHVGRVDKELICEEEKADIFIDDDIKITARVAEHNNNMKGFLASTPYNKTQDISLNVIRIENINEILKFI